MIYSTLNHQELPFSDPTHPPLWWRNTWMLPKIKRIFVTKIVFVTNNIWFNSLGCLQRWASEFGFDSLRSDRTFFFIFQHQTTHHLPWLIWRDSTSCSLSAELVMSTWMLSIHGSQVIHFNNSRRKLRVNFGGTLGELKGTQRELPRNFQGILRELTRNPERTLNDL